VLAKVRNLFNKTVVLAFFVSFILFSLFLVNLPDVALLSDQYPLPRDLETGEPLTLSLTRPENWVSGRSLSPFLKKAVLISEDDAFYQHDGIDWNQLKRALEERFEEGGRLRGASTITQQVAKNLYLTSEKSFIRKIKEAMIARSIERELSKDRILEIYLNVVEFGQGIYGAPRAARFYFKKSVTQLTPKESAFLAMLLPNPKKYSISFRRGSLTPYANSSINRILLRMRQVGWIDDELYSREIGTPLNFEKAAIEARTEETLKARGDLRTQDSEEALETHARREEEGAAELPPQPEVESSPEAAPLEPTVQAPSETSPPSGP
jgi:monofunctional biosynthetic peptidoglycan transglycosylase